jgi:hypothetical protein
MKLRLGFLRRNGDIPLLLAVVGFSSSSCPAISLNAIMATSLGRSILYVQGRGLTFLRLQRGVFGANSKKSGNVLYKVIFEDRAFNAFTIDISSRG